MSALPPLIWGAERRQSHRQYSGCPPSLPDPLRTGQRLVRAQPDPWGQPLPHHCSSPEHLAQVSSRGWGRCRDSAYVLHVGSNALTQEGLQGQTGEMGQLLDHGTPSLAGRGAHHSLASPEPQGRAPCKAQGIQAGRGARVRYLQGLCCCRHHLGVWGEEAVHGSREEPGQVSPAQVLLQPGEERKARLETKQPPLPLPGRGPCLHLPRLMCARSMVDSQVSSGCRSLVLGT